MGRHSNSRARRFVLAFLILALTGCASRYHEPPRSNNQVAQLDATVPVWIASIDGKKVSRVGFTGHKSFVITAGNHLLEVQYSQVQSETSSWNVQSYHYAQSKSYVPVKFTAIAGRTYYVEAGRKGDMWRPYVTDRLQPVFQDPGVH